MNSVYGQRPCRGTVEEATLCQVRKYISNLSKKFANIFTERTRARHWPQLFSLNAKDVHPSDVFLNQTVYTCSPYLSVLYNYLHVDDTFICFGDNIS